MTITPSPFSVNSTFPPLFKPLSLSLAHHTVLQSFPLCPFPQIWSLLCFSLTLSLSQSINRSLNNNDELLSVFIQTALIIKYRQCVSRIGCGRRGTRRRRRRSSGRRRRYGKVEGEVVYGYGWKLGREKKKKEVKRGVRKLVWLAEQLLSLPSTPSLAPHPSLPRSALYSVEMTGGKLYCSEFVSIGAPQRG